MRGVVADIKRDQIKRLAEHGQREDGRRPDEFRPLTIEKNPIGSAEGSARIKLGNTDIIVGVKLSVGTPFPDKPSEGVLMTATELKPMAHPAFDAGPPKPESIEIARVIDRGIRESGMIDLNKLCIEPGDKVWMLHIDIQAINYDGNIFDAGNIGSIVALSGSIVPANKYGVGDDFSLPVSECPISSTYVKINDCLLLDPTYIEEQVADARLTIITDTNGDIRAMQKGLSGAFSYEEISTAIDGSITLGKEIREKINVV